LSRKSEQHNEKRQAKHERNVTPRDATAQNETIISGGSRKKTKSKKKQKAGKIEKRKQ